MKKTSKQLLILDKDDLTEVLESLISENISREFEKNVFKDNNSPLLTRDEVAEMLDISLPTLLQWEKDWVITNPKRLSKNLVSYNCNLSCFSKCETFKNIYIGSRLQLFPIESAIPRFV